MRKAYVPQDIRVTGIVRSQKCKRLTLQSQKEKYRQKISTKYLDHPRMVWMLDFANAKGKMKSNLPN